jgi:hypothetical protein
MDKTTNMTKFAWYIDPMEPVISITANEAGIIFALVTLEGRVYITHRKKLSSPGYYQK